MLHSANCLTPHQWLSPPFCSTALHIADCCIALSRMTVENGAAEMEAVKITNKAMVLPRRAPEKGTCPLVTFDLPYITFYYNQKLMLYKLAAAEFGRAVERLKQGLAAAVEYYYPLAGRLRQDEEKVLFVECEREGLVGAEGVSVVELAEGENAEMLQQLVPYAGVMNLEGLHRPLLAVQFTKLNGGIAIGCSFNHTILDGNSTWQFMASWADLTRSGGDGVIPFPIHDRTFARSVRLPLQLPATALDHERGDPNGPAKPLVARVFSFSDTAVDVLKVRANAGLPPAAKPLSTFQSLGAHVWRSVSRARALKPEDITVFAIFADCRSRVDPPMPEAYFGNLIQAIFTGTAAGLLLGSPPEFAAGMLQQVIEAHNAEAIKKRLEEYEAAPKLFYYSDAGMNCVAVGSSPRFKVYDVDFSFGKPERVRSGSNNKFDGMVYLYPGREGGRSIDVELTLEAGAMARLEKDKDFVKPC